MYGYSDATNKDGEGRGLTRVHPASKGYGCMLITAILVGLAVLFVMVPAIFSPILEPVFAIMRGGG